MSQTPKINERVLVKGTRLKTVIGEITVEQIVRTSPTTWGVRFIGTEGPDQIALDDVSKIISIGDGPLVKRDFLAYQKTHITGTSFFDETTKQTFVGNVDALCLYVSNLAFVTNVRKNLTRFEGNMSRAQIMRLFLKSGLVNSCRAIETFSSQIVSDIENNETYVKVEKHKGFILSKRFKEKVNRWIARNHLRFLVPIKERPISANSDEVFNAPAFFAKTRNNAKTNGVFFLTEEAAKNWNGSRVMVLDSRARRVTHIPIVAWFDPHFRTKEAINKEVGRGIDGLRDATYRMYRDNGFKPAPSIAQPSSQGEDKNA